MRARTWNERHGAVATAIDRRWSVNKCATGFTVAAEVKRSPSRTLRRELQAYLGRPVSGRQWRRWAKVQRRAEREASR